MEIFPVPEAEIFGTGFRVNSLAYEDFAPGLARAAVTAGIRENGGELLTGIRKATFCQLEAIGRDLWLGERRENENLAINFRGRGKLSGADDRTKLGDSKILHEKSDETIVPWLGGDAFGYLLLHEENDLRGSVWLGKKLADDRRSNVIRNIAGDTVRIGGKIGKIGLKDVGTHDVEVLARKRTGELTGELRIILNSSNMREVFKQT